MWNEVWQNRKNDKQKVYETIMISKVRLNYTEVNEYIANKVWNHCEESRLMIDQAIELFKLIEQVKIKRGTILLMFVNQKYYVKTVM